jgi:hypothetical protein
LFDDDASKLEDKSRGGNGGRVQGKGKERNRVGGEKTMNEE